MAVGLSGKIGGQMKVMGGASEVLEKRQQEHATLEGQGFAIAGARKQGGRCMHAQHKGPGSAGGQIRGCY